MFYPIPASVFIWDGTDAALVALRERCPTANAHVVGPVQILHFTERFSKNASVGLKGWLLILGYEIVDHGHLVGPARCSLAALVEYARIVGTVLNQKEADATKGTQAPA